ncbi:MULTISPECIES: TRAP transporter substrate-binding protein [unclassified Oscillibacter]|uniref:TRAP transporter substrate-binding protein n=1 Tax=unclassified Oscillibacter TaxID=2629304 RepID=UPI0025FCE4ED|nr:MULTISPECIES: TRAP transporter substrate-binding protein [unclassified Oscillibacter]
MKKRPLSILAMLLIATLLTGCGIVQNTPTVGGPSTADGATAIGDTQSLPLAGASIVLKISHTDNDASMLSNTWNCYARTFKSFLETYSGGEMSAEIFPNSQLGDETSCVEQCSQGSIDIVLGAASGNLASWVPDFNVFDIPYLVDNLDAFNLVCQGTLLDELNTQLGAAGNMRVLSLMATGFRNLDTWNKRVESVNDLRGMKIRVQSIDAHTTMIKAWGAMPTTVSFSELYSAASTGVIDAFENPNYTLFMNNLYEAVNYVTQTNHLANTSMCLISGKTFDNLTAEQQRWVQKAAAEARRAAIGVVSANNVNVLANLKESGVEIISLSDEQLAEFRDACYETCKETVLQTVDAGFYQKFQDSYASAEKLLGIAK